MCPDGNLGGYYLFQARLKIIISVIRWSSGENPWIKQGFGFGPGIVSETSNLSLTLNATDTIRCTYMY